MFPSTVWTLSAESEAGIQTSLHTSDFTAYLALIAFTFGARGNQNTSEAAKYNKAVDLLTEGHKADPELAKNHWERYIELTDYIEDRTTERGTFQYDITAHNLQDAHTHDLQAIIALAAA